MDQIDNKFISRVFNCLISNRIEDEKSSENVVSLLEEVAKLTGSFGKRASHFLATRGTLDLTIYLPTKEGRRTFLKGSVRRFKNPEVEKVWAHANEEKNNRLFLESVKLMMVPTENKKAIVSKLAHLRLEYEDDFEMLKKAFNSFDENMGGLNLQVNEALETMPYSYEIMKLLSWMPALQIEDEGSLTVAMKAMKKYEAGPYNLRTISFAGAQLDRVQWAWQELNYTRYECNDVPFSFDVGVMNSFWDIFVAKDPKPKVSVLVFKSDWMFFDLEQVKEDLDDCYRKWYNTLIFDRRFDVDYRMRLVIDMDQAAEENETSEFELQLWFIGEFFYWSQRDSYV